jgi:hypothetical protein
MSEKTLLEARKETFEAALFGKGKKCPCCDRFVKVYKRKFNSAMGRALIILYRHYNSPMGMKLGPEEWVHFPTLLMGKGAQRSDEGKLAIWGLVEKLSGLRDDGSKRNGFYRITDLGRKFARSEIDLPAHAFLYYGGQVLGFSDGDKYPKALVRIGDVFGKSFNYREMMEAPYGE